VCQIHENSKESLMTRARIEVVSAAEIKRLFEAGEVAVYDVREQGEWDAGHIPGATLNPLSAFDPARIQVPEGKRVVLHCQRGMRCGPASEMLALSGYKGDILRMEGGFLAWRGVGGPVET
jgi:rhodanese-related sulfurtransferase